MRLRPFRKTLSALLLPFGWILFAAAQQGFFKFEHFKSYPSGRWSTELQGFRNGTALGPPQVTTGCSDRSNAMDAAKIKALANNAATTCTGRLLVDQPLLAEYEQVCRVGSGTQTIHQTLRAVDDRTLTSEVRSSIRGSNIGETVMRSTTHYLGACSASEIAASKASMPRITRKCALSFPK